MATHTVFLSTQCRVHCYVWTYAVLSQSKFFLWHHVMANVTYSGPMNIGKSLRESINSCIFLLITCSGTAYRRMRDNTPISSENPGFLIHNWSEASLWRLYYSVSDIFMVHILAHHPHRTIFEVCALPKYRCRPYAQIYNNNASGGHLPTWVCHTIRSTGSDSGSMLVSFKPCTSLQVHFTWFNRIFVVQVRNPNSWWHVTTSQRVKTAGPVSEHWHQVPQTIYKNYVELIPILSVGNFEGERWFYVVLNRWLECNVSSVYNYEYYTVKKTMHIPIFSMFTFYIKNTKKKCSNFYSIFYVYFATFSRYFMKKIRKQKLRR